MLAGVMAFRRASQNTEGLLNLCVSRTGLWGSLCRDSQWRASSSYQRPEVHATTILCVRKDDMVVLIGDGQVSVGPVTVKPNVRKVRRIGDGVVAGFAGTAADGLSLLERLEMKLEEHPGQLLRAAVELAKQWRQDKALRFLQAELLVADSSTTLTISGNGDVLEPHDGVMAVGSGGNFALAAARALMDVPGMDAITIGKKAMKIAADMCIYTNDNFTIETIAVKLPGAPGAGDAAASGTSYP
ncbi:hypothetical protein Vafri_10847 [Volvox africanus]|uniref:Uncharacterized protein n=1 Tax=Volvox africanus TaxID=51714 RepID=A0A8J4B6S7_9CHLO|nr:hypothetical protein Vafri_10847 [Volvox africanus]